MVSDHPRWPWIGHLPHLAFLYEVHDPSKGIYLVKGLANGQTFNMPISLN